MLKILLVDDESLIRQGLKKIITNAGKDYIVCGEAGNGKEAIEFIKNTDVDVVITDVRMPVMDGLELAKQIDEKYKRISTVMVSAYGDYDYVRTSLKTGAVDYLLKPIENSEMLETLANITRKKNGAGANADKISCPDSYYEFGSADSLIKNFLKNEPDLFDGENIKNTFFVSAVSLCTSGSTDEENTLFDKMSGEEIASLARKFHFTAYYSPKTRTLLLISNQNPQNTANIKSFLSEFAKNMSNKTNTYVQAGASFNSDDEKTAGNLISQSETALEHLKFYEPFAKIILYQNMPPYNPLSREKLSHIEKRLLNSAEILNAEKTKTFAFELFDYFENGYISPSDIKNTVSDFIYKLAFSSADFKNFFVKNFKSIDICAREIIKTEPLPALKIKFKNTVLNAIRSIVTIKQTGNKKVVEKAKKYINENFRENVTLKDVADFVSMNSSYFSELFKSETGTNFIDFLTEIRINTAKDLLENSEIKVKEIGYLIGYENNAYFNRVFKKRVGVTPSEYRRIK